MADYITNSLDERDLAPDYVDTLAIVGLVVSSIVLVHSWFKNKLVFKPVRILTEISAVCTLICCALSLYEGQTPSPLNNAVISQLLITGLLNWMTQVADNLIFYLRYAAAMRKVPLWKKVAVGAYIFIVMTISWTPTYTFCPLFTDTNDVDFAATYTTPGLLIYTWGNVLYNFVFTDEFVRILYRVHYLESKQYSAAAQNISIKCILHCFLR
jgi:hypothetical protein